jgi:hypothetical protein
VVDISDYIGVEIDKAYLKKKDVIKFGSQCLHLLVHPLTWLCPCGPEVGHRHSLKILGQLFLKIWS